MLAYIHTFIVSGIGVKNCATFRCSRQPRTGPLSWRVAGWVSEWALWHLSFCRMEWMKKTITTEKWREPLEAKLLPRLPSAHRRVPFICPDGGPSVNRVTWKTTTSLPRFSCRLVVSSKIKSQNCHTKHQIGIKLTPWIAAAARAIKWRQRTDCHYHVGIIAPSPSDGVINVLLTAQLSHSTCRISNTYFQG